MDRETQNRLSQLQRDVTLLRERIDRSTLYVYQVVSPHGGAAAPLNAPFVLAESDARLGNGRVLEAGADIALVDGGAGAALTVSRAGNVVLRFDNGNDALAQYARSGAGIAQALAAAAPGDIVLVPTGLYTGDLSVPDGVLLCGSGWTTVINGVARVGNGAYLTDCRVTQAGDSATTLAAVRGPETGNCVLFRCYVECSNATGEGYGISAYGGGDVYVYECVVSGSTGDLECL